MPESEQRTEWLMSDEPAAQSTVGSAWPKFQISDDVISSDICYIINT